MSGRQDVAVLKKPSNLVKLFSDQSNLLRENRAKCSELKAFEREFIVFVRVERSGMKVVHSFITSLFNYVCVSFFREVSTVEETDTFC